MLRLFLISSLCTFFLACSSEDNSEALVKWFGDQGLATSYSKDSAEIEISVKNIAVGFNDSAYNSYPVLGNMNGIEHMLYFDFKGDTLKFKIDTIFYNNTPEASKPPEHLEATIYWLIDSLSQDSTKTILEWKTDAFFVELPEKFLELEARPPVGLKLRSDNMVLRIVPESQITQKINKTDDCKSCLHAGVRESLLVTFEIKDKEKMNGKTVVFAELVLPKQGDTTGSELGLPVAVYVGDEGFVNSSNLVFNEGASLMLRVTKSLRNYAIAANSQPDTLDFTLWLDLPGHYIERSYYRPAYARYDFSSAIEAGKTAKLKLWFADYGDKK